MKKTIIFILMLSLALSVNALPYRNQFYREINTSWENRGMWLILQERTDFSEDGKYVKTTSGDDWEIEEFDDKGNLIHKINDDGIEYKYVFDKAGHLIKSERIVPGKHDEITNYKYDKSGLCTYFKTEDKIAGTWKEAKYNKAKNNTLKKQSNGKEVIHDGDAQGLISCKYDERGNLIEKTEYWNSNVQAISEWKFDEQNRLIYEYIYSDDLQKWYEYDEKGNQRIVKEYCPGTDFTILYEYDAKGFLVKQTSPNSEIIFQNNEHGIKIYSQEKMRNFDALIDQYYDDKGNVVFSNQEAAYNKYYEYEYYPSGKIKTKFYYIQDSKFRPDSCMLVEESNWDDHGNLTYHMKTEDRGRSLFTERAVYEYNADGKLIHQKLSLKDKSGEEFFDYNSKGLLLHSKVPYGRECWFEYDNKDNLIHVKDSLAYEETYRYDEKGKRIYFMSKTPVEPDDWPNAIPYEDRISTPKEPFVIYEEWSEYNSKGILTSYKNSRGDFDIYDDEGKLIHFKKLKNERELEGWYSYDKQGRRLTYKNNNDVEGTYTYTEDGFEHYKTNKGYENWNLYDSKGNVVYSEDDNAYSFFEYDAHGNKVYEYQGAVVNHRRWFVNEYWDNGQLKSVKCYCTKS